MSCKRHDKVTRREFVGRTCLAAAGVSLGVLAGFEASCSASDRGGPKKKKRGATKSHKGSLGAKVVSRSDTKVFGKGGHDPGRVARIVQRSVADLVGARDYREAFRALFDPK
ncbi:MAG: hypothetical protein JRH11_14745, partial [Deltaproteobacteria bacterium]|nr:hypothetical protein [Deltaproteobacteria bacterium]